MQPKLKLRDEHGTMKAYLLENFVIQQWRFEKSKSPILFQLTNQWVRIRVKNNSQPL